MNCAKCQSSNRADFAAEMMIHFSGISNIHNPGVLVCPKVSVCLDCGTSRFTTSAIELRVLRRGIISSCGSLIGGVESRTSIQRNIPALSTQG
jgi:hypothetical protein